MPTNKTGILAVGHVKAPVLALIVVGKAQALLLKLLNSSPPCLRRMLCLAVCA